MFNFFFIYFDYSIFSVVKIFGVKWIIVKKNKIWRKRDSY